jgi:hypothetical protein
MASFNQMQSMGASLRITSARSHFRPSSPLSERTSETRRPVARILLLHRGADVRWKHGRRANHDLTQFHAEILHESADAYLCSGIRRMVGEERWDQTGG